MLNLDLNYLYEFVAFKRSLKDCHFLCGQQSGDFGGGEERDIREINGNGKNTIKNKIKKLTLLSQEKLSRMAVLGIENEISKKVALENIHEFGSMKPEKQNYSILCFINI